MLINKIAECDKDNNNTTWNAPTVYYSLGADIDFGNQVIAPVGKGSAGFRAMFMGNKHTLKNAYLDFYDSPYGVGSYLCSGLFNTTRATTEFYDLILDSTIKIDATKYTSGNTTSTSAMGNTRQLLIGGLLGWSSYSPTFCNIISKVTITLQSTSTTQSQVGHIGGILGASWSNSNVVRMYNCVSSANITYKGANAALGVNNNAHLGGLIGEVNSATSSITIQNCAVTGSTITDYNDGVCMGALIGHINSNATTKPTININNVVINATLSMPGTAANYTSPDVGIIVGIAQYGFDPAKTSISDIYITGGSPTNQLYSTQTGDLDITTAMSASFSNIQTSAATSATITPSTLAAKVTKNGSASAVATKANADADIAAVMTVASNGTVTSKTATNNITFNRGSGATGGPTTYMTYPSTGAAQNITVTAPTRTGYTFKGWSLTGYQGTVSGTTTYLTTLANQGGNLTAYAVWEVNAFTGTAPSDVTIVYGSNATFSAAGLSSPPGTSSSTYGVNISYQWKNSAGTAIIPPPKKK